MAFREVSQEELQSHVLSDLDTASGLGNIINGGKQKQSPFSKLKFPKITVTLPAKKDRISTLPPLAIDDKVVEHTVPEPFVPEPFVPPIEVEPVIPDIVEEPVIPVSAEVLREVAPIEKEAYKRAFREHQPIRRFASRPKVIPPQPTVVKPIEPVVPIVTTSSVASAPMPIIPQPQPVVSDIQDTAAIYGTPLPMKGDPLHFPEAKKSIFSNLRLRQPSQSVGTAIISVFFAVRIVLGGCLVSVGLISMGSEYSTMRFAGDIGAMYLQYNVANIVVTVGLLIIYDALRNH
jgi:hypothetical protein